MILQDKNRPGIMANTRVDTVELCEVVRVMGEQLVAEWKADVQVSAAAG